MNTIRQWQSGQPACEGRSLDALARQFPKTQVTEVSGEDAHVVGDSGSGKDDVVNAGDLRVEANRATGQPASAPINSDRGALGLGSTSPGLKRFAGQISKFQSEVGED